MHALLVRRSGSAYSPQRTFPVTALAGGKLEPLRGSWSETRRVAVAAAFSRDQVTQYLATVALNDTAHKALREAGNWSTSASPGSTRHVEPF